MDYNNSHNTGLTPKQHASQAIAAAESVLITTGQHPTVDQVAAVMALALILRKLGKKVTAMVSDQIPYQMNFLASDILDTKFTGLRDFIMKLDLSKAEVDKLKYTIEDGKLNVHITPFKGSFSQSDVAFEHGAYHYDIAVVLGVPNRSRVDRIYEQNKNLFEIPIVNIDFHRSNENYGAINLIEPMAASLAEILLALGESLQQGILDEQLATVMLTGIMASTDRFTATHTTAKSLTVAAQLMAAGAKQQNVVKGLYKSSPKPQVEAQRPQSQQSPKPAPQASAPVTPAKPHDIHRPSASLGASSVEGASQLKDASSTAQSDKQPEPQADLKTLKNPEPDSKSTEPSIEEILPPQHMEMSVDPALAEAVSNLNNLAAELGSMKQGVETDLPNEGEQAKSNLKTSQA